MLQAFSAVDDAPDDYARATVTPREYLDAWSTIWAGFASSGMLNIVTTST
jgi:hypothetical protein